MYQKEQFQTERGSVTLIVSSFVFPLLLFVFALSFDVSSYYLETRSRQRIIDEATLHAYRFLPYTQEANQVAMDFLARHPEVLDGTQVQITPDSVTLQHKAKVPLLLSSFFGALIGDTSLAEGLTLTAVSRSTGTPYDTLLLLDTSEALAPELPFGTPWGDPITNPTSSFLANTYPPQYALGANNQAQQIDPWLLTQQCFNPVFSTLKLSLIRTYEYLSSFSLNAIGVGVFPGNGAYVDYVREVLPAQASGDPSDAAFLEYHGQYLGNEHCAGAAESEPSGSIYQFPNSANGMTGLWQPPVGQSGPMIDPQTFEYNLNYAPFLSVSQSIWSQAVKSGFLTDTPKVIEAIRADIVGSTKVEARAGLSSRQVRSAVVFAGDVPSALGIRFPDFTVQTALSQELTLLKSDIKQYNFFFQLYYVVYQHPGNLALSPSIVNQLQSYFAQEEKVNGKQEEFFRIHLITGTDVNQLQSSVTALLALDKRRSLLAK